MLASWITEMRKFMEIGWVSLKLNPYATDDFYLALNSKAAYVA